MLQTISKKQIEQAAKQYANETPNKYWQEAVDVFNFMSEFLSKQKKDNIIFNENKRTIIHNGQELILPRKEYLLALYLYNNSNRIVSRDELLDNIWAGLCVVDRTVDVHIRHLRVKLSSANIITKKGFGYMWVEGEESLEEINLKEGIDFLGDIYQYKDNEKEGYIDVAHKDNSGKIIGWMTVKFGTGVFK